MQHLHGIQKISLLDNIPNAQKINQDRTCTPRLLISVQSAKLAKLPSFTHGVTVPTGYRFSVDISPVQNGWHKLSQDANFPL